MFRNAKNARVARNIKDAKNINARDDGNAKDARDDGNTKNAKNRDARDDGNAKNAKDARDDGNAKNVKNARVAQNAKNVRNAKNIRNIRIILCSLAALSLVMLAGILAVKGKILKIAFLSSDEKQERQSPDELLERYYALIAEEGYGEMYQMLDEASQANISLDDFIERNKNIYRGIAADGITIEVIDVAENGKDAEVLYDAKMDTVAGEVAFRNKAVFEMDGEGRSKYALYWEDSLIFPELKSSDKVRVATVEAKRGNIYDRGGMLLAGEGMASSVGLVPGRMNADSKEDLKKLAGLLGVSAGSIRKKLGAKWVKSDSFVPVKTVEKLTELEQMSGSTDERVARKMERDAALLSIPGVMMTDTKIRQYPLGEAASHLVGYIQNVTAEDLEGHPGEGYHENSMIGRSGMEGLYETELRGQDGCEIRIIDAGGKVKSVLAGIEKQDGEDIYLTIDAGLQEAAYHAFSRDKSCSVAMDPYTGEVLALVSTPSFNSNDFILGVSKKLWASLNEDKKMPLYNRFRQKLCPGSLLKPVVAAVGLRTGAVSPQEDYGNEGLSWQKDESWGSYYVTTLHAYEPVILENALVYSDNIYFAKAALKIGKEDFQAQLERLGFQKEMPFEIALAQSQYSNSGDIGSEIQLADSGYGQGEVLANPVHLAALYTGFVNKGNAIKPYLLRSEGKGKEIWLESAYLPDQAELIRQALVKAVESEDGTGHGAYRKGTVLAAKTGTAEIKQSTEDKEGTELGWFCVFTAEEGQEEPLLLLSMAEDVKGRGGSGYVVEKDSQILDYWFGRRSE